MSSQKPGTVEEAAPGIEAVVGKIRGNDDDRFAVSYPRGPRAPVPEGTSVTFSLKNWEGKGEPRKGQVVLLFEVELFVKGWRAQRARPVQLTPAISQKPEGGEV